VEGKGGLDCAYQGVGIGEAWPLSTLALDNRAVVADGDVCGLSLFGHNSIVRRAKDDKSDQWHKVGSGGDSSCRSVCVKA